MSPRAIWKGAVSFGMVAIPIKLYPATKSKDVSFASLHTTCHTRINHRKYCAYHETFVEQDELVKGYQYTKDQYVVMEAADFQNLPASSTHTINITRFVDLASIDPTHFEKSDYLEPEGVGQKPFQLLNRALKDTNRVAIAKVSIRQKEHLCCLRPYNNGIIMATMHFPDEIRPTGELELPEEEALVSDQEVAMATMLIDQLTGTFEPEGFQDEYRVALERVIEVKLGSAEPDTTVTTQPKSTVGDLMEALRASIEASKQAAPVESNGGSASSSAAKRRSKKKATLAGGS